MNKDKFSKNVILDYIFSFLHNFGVSQAIWVLFMVCRGQSLIDVGIAEGVFHVTSLLCEVPSGAAADLFGRKKVLIAGRLLSAVSSVCMLCAHSLPAFCVSFAFSALSFNLLSGTEDALVYDSMKAAGSEDGYIRVSSRINIIIEIAQGAGTFAGGVLSDRSFELCYLADIAVAAISVLPLLWMKEPPVSDDRNGREGRVSLTEHFKTAAMIIRDNPAVLRIILYYPVITAFDAVLFFYGQQYFADFGLSRIQISLIMVFSSACSCAAALCCTGILSRFKDKTKYMISVLMGACIIGCSFRTLISAVIFFILANAVNALICPIESSSLNALIPSAQRATIISADSMCYSLAMIIFFPLCGVLATRFSLNTTFAVLGVTELCMMGLLLTVRKKGEKAERHHTSS